MTLGTHEYDVFIAERVRNKFTVNNIKPLNFTLVMAARTARRTMTGPLEHLTSNQKVLHSNPSWIPYFFPWIYFSFSLQKTSLLNF